MRVGVVAVIVPVVVVVVAPGDGPHVLRGDDDRRLGAGGLDQPLDPALEAEAVDDDETRLGDPAGVARCRGIAVGVGVGADEARHRHTLTADLAHEVRQDREGRHRLQRRFGGERGRESEQDQTDRRQRPP